MNLFEYAAQAALLDNLGDKQEITLKDDFEACYPPIFNHWGVENNEAVRRMAVKRENIKASRGKNEIPSILRKRLL